MTDFFTYSTLSGRRIQRIPILDGSWSDTLGAAGDLSCKVSLRNPLVRRLDLRNSAQPGFASLAAVDGDLVHQAGPIWVHDVDEDKGYLTLRAQGAMSITDHRALLPVLNGRLPSDPTTDTRFMPVDLAPDSKYPWPTDTRTSRQGMVVKLLEQMMSHPSSSFPWVLPAAIPGTQQDSWRGVDTAPVGERLRQISQLSNGVDMHWQPRWNASADGFEHVVRIGTPSQPLLYSSLRPVFTAGVAASSITNLRTAINGSRLGSQAFSVGGASADDALAAVAFDPTLLAAGFPLLDLFDESRSTVSELSTLQQYANEVLDAGQKPLQLWSFTHDVRRRPFPSSFAVGDFTRLRLVKSYYSPAGQYGMRLLSRSGDARGLSTNLTFQPSGEYTPGEN